MERNRERLDPEQHADRCGVVIYDAETDFNGCDTGKNNWVRRKAAVY